MTDVEGEGEGPLDQGGDEVASQDAPKWHFAYRVIDRHPVFYVLAILETAACACLLTLLGITGAYLGAWSVASLRSFGTDCVLFTLLCVATTVALACLRTARLGLHETRHGRFRCAPPTALILLSMTTCLPLATFSTIRLMVTRSHSSPGRIYCDGMLRDRLVGRSEPPTQGGSRLPCPRWYKVEWRTAEDVLAAERALLQMLDEGPDAIAGVQDLRSATAQQEACQARFGADALAISRSAVEAAHVELGLSYGGEMADFFRGHTADARVLCAGGPTAIRVAVRELERTVRRSPFPGVGTESQYRVLRASYEFAPDAHRGDTPSWAFDWFMMVVFLIGVAAFIRVPRPIIGSDSPAFPYAVAAVGAAPLVIAGACLLVWRGGGSLSGQTWGPFLPSQIAELGFGSLALVFMSIAFPRALLASGARTVARDLFFVACYGWIPILATMTLVAVGPVVWLPDARIALPAVIGSGSGVPAWLAAPAILAVVFGVPAECLALKYEQLPER